jgi:signal transduction histidine kinase
LEWLTHHYWRGIATDILSLAVWTALIAVVNLLPLEGWESAPFVADDPICAAAAVVLAPAETALVVFLGAMDIRELRHETSLGKSIWNRSQLSFSWFLASWVVHRLSPHNPSAPELLALSIVALLTGVAANYLLVSASIAIGRGFRPLDVLRHLRLGTVQDIAVSAGAWVGLTAMLALLYREVGILALPIFLGPCLLGRQALQRGQMFLEAAKAHRQSEAALSRIAQEIRQERLDERRLIAAQLHDEVIQPLFKVTLLAEVVRRELASGQLLELDRDIPDLASAAHLASDGAREAVGDLQRSAIGRGGLKDALNRLVEGIRSAASCRVNAKLEEVAMEEDAQLAFYQIAKEALENALHHGRPESIELDLSQDGRVIQMAVADDGRGFDTAQLFEGHFGLQIMRERARIVGASLYVDATPGLGCLVRVVLAPAGEETRTNEATDDE